MGLFNRLWSARYGKFTCMVLMTWIGISLIALVWTPYPLLATNGFHAWQSPSLAHWLGTDGTGSDIASWLMAGSSTELLLVVATVVCTACVGFMVLIASLARVLWIRASVVVFLDVLISLPTVLLALMLAVPFGASIGGMVIACGVGYGLNLARIVRPTALVSLQSEYVTAASCYGARHCYVLFRHVIPNSIPIVVVQLSLSAGTVILAESGLTYLGIGTPSAVASWGRVLTTSLALIHVHPLTVLWPGLLISVIVLTLNMFGDVLRVALEPTEWTTTTLQGGHHES